MKNEEGFSFRHHNSEHISRGPTESSGFSLLIPILLGVVIVIAHAMAQAINPH